jgi:hypothetical protein
VGQNEIPINGKYPSQIELLGLYSGVVGGVYMHLRVI